VGSAVEGAGHQGAAAGLDGRAQDGMVLQVVGTSVGVERIVGVEAILVAEVDGVGRAEDTIPQDPVADSSAESGLGQITADEDAVEAVEGNGVAIARTSSADRVIVTSFKDVDALTSIWSRGRTIGCHADLIPPNDVPGRRAPEDLDAEFRIPGDRI